MSSWNYRSEQMWLRLAGVTLALLVLTGCGLTRRLRGVPTFVNHPRPDLAMDFSAFEDVGCTRRVPKAICLECEPDSALAALGCDEICVPNSALARLVPAYPIGECITSPYAGDRDETEFLRCRGGLIRRCMRYVVDRDGVCEIIDSTEDLQETFAPIESEAEALGYVVANVGGSQYYGLEFNPDYEYYVDVIEDTHVETVADGFQVHLFRYQYYGCGPHETYTVVYHVNHEGEIVEEKMEAIFRDPGEDNICVD